jgi:hypothetical protein
MPNNINISSGSTSFQNKIFGSIVKLTKPSFAYQGKIFSDTSFLNQKIISLLEDDTYYFNHGLPNEIILYDLDYPIDVSIELNNLSILNTLITSQNSVADRNMQAIFTEFFPPSNEPDYECSTDPSIP